MGFQKGERVRGPGDHTEWEEGEPRTKLKRVSTFKYRTRKEPEKELGCVYTCEIKYAFAPAKGGDFMTGCGESG